MRFKKNNGDLIFSDKIILSENNNEDNISIDVTRQDYFDILKNYLKKLKSLNLTIYLEKEVFETLELDVSDEDLDIDDIEDYVKFRIKESYDDIVLDDFFFKYYEMDNGLYKIFIFYRVFIEELIEFIIENNLVIQKIVIRDDLKDEYILDDYDSFVISKNNNKKTHYVFLIIVICIIISFLVLKFYNYKLQNKIASCDIKISSKERIIDNLKIEQEKLENTVLNLKNKNKFQKKETFEDKIFRILKLIPDDIILSYIHFENNKLTLKGNAENKNSIFSLIEILDKDSQITKNKYDYVVKQQNFYVFLIEVTVL